MRSPLLLLATFFALGIWGASYASAEGGASPGEAALCLGIGAGSCLAGLIALQRGKNLVPTMAVLAGFTSAGAAAALLFPLRFGPDHISRIEERRVDTGRTLGLEGRLVTAPLRNPYGFEFDLAATVVEQNSGRRPVNGRVRLWVEMPSPQIVATTSAFEWGDWVRATVELRRPKAYQNPGDFNYRSWMESTQDIYWEGTVRGAGSLEKVSGPKPGWFESRAFALRHQGLAAIDRMFPPWAAQEKDGAVLKAVLFGDRSSLDSETIENFRKTGLYHLLVVAGLHVGLLAMLAGLLLRIFPLGETSRSLAVLALVVAYALVVEQRAPTLRATVMIAAYLVGRMLYRERSLLNAVGMAALALLFIRPAWLLEAGFDLSFSAALLIAGLAVPILDRTTAPYRIGLYHLDDVEREIRLPPKIAQFRLDLRTLAHALERRLRVLARHPGFASIALVAAARTVAWTSATLLFSLILQTGLILPMVLAFHRVTFAGVALNALSVPVMVLVLALAFPSIALVAIVPSLAPVPAAILGLVLRVLFALTRLPHLFGWLSYRVPGPPLWVALGFAFSLVVGAWTTARHTRIFVAALASFGVFLILVCVHPFAPDLPAGVMEVTALDCGDGDAVFLVLRDRSTVLINTCGAREHAEHNFWGRRWNAGEEIISPYLWSRGIERLDVLALTHTPGEQSESVEALARNFKVGEFWLDIPRTRDRLARAYELLDGLRRSGARARELMGGDRLAIGGASINVLWPPAPSAGESEPPTAMDTVASVVRVAEGEASVLLAGHLTAKVARALVGSGVPVESRLVQVSPQGFGDPSREDFLAAVSPQVVWTSGGRIRRHTPNSPAPDSRHARSFRPSTALRVFNTDLDGAIEMTLRGSELSVRCYRSSSTGWTAGAGTGWLLASPTSRVR